MISFFILEADRNITEVPEAAVVYFNLSNSMSDVSTVKPVFQDIVPHPLQVAPLSRGLPTIPWHLQWDRQPHQRVSRATLTPCISIVTACPRNSFFRGHLHSENSSHSTLLSQKLLPPLPSCQDVCRELTSSSSSLGSSFKLTTRWGPGSGTAKLQITFPSGSIRKGRDLKYY